ncbi:hypothetical protein [Xanthovirga aplysinae]|uniref:hypothetical protein n=1 Tax=Xanthovirga aplysinae TaxID=2529853 RepID=UPI0012BCA573|nr:hypothetical protein [Xanthovirga aplysinae]MTI32307.1 hypothetical protein [Xanthovirga aplysinae]
MSKSFNFFWPKLSKHQFILTFLVLSSFSAFSQELKFLKKVRIPLIHQVEKSSDHQLLIADHNGDLLKYSLEGELLYQFHSSNSSPYTSIDASKGLICYAFSQDLQKYQSYNRFLVKLSDHNFRLDNLGYVTAMAPSNDQQLWIFDSSDLNLKKYSPVLKRVTLEVYFQNLDHNFGNIDKLIEFQNLLFLQNIQDGQLFILDNKGNFLRELKITSNASLQFKGEDLYYLNLNKVVFQNIYSQEKHTITLSPKKNYNQALMFETKLLLFGKDFFDIYEFKPTSLSKE